MFFFNLFNRIANLLILKTIINIIKYKYIQQIYTVSQSLHCIIN